ncbi:MAG: L-rhamnose isomerase, partial [Thermoguttaceae bacterium]
MLEPLEQMRKWEAEGDYSSRLAMLEELKTLPFGPVWDMYCERHNVPVGTDWIQKVRKYETDVLSKRE